MDVSIEIIPMHHMTSSRNHMPYFLYKAPRR